jgi:phosphatidylglycerophosphate synthase
MAVTDRHATSSAWEPAVGLTAQVAILAGLSATVGLGAAGWAAGAAYALVSWALLSRALRSAAGAMGPADRVTLARATLIGGVTGLAADQVAAPAGAAARPWSVAVLVALATVALVLDAVDGRVARRTGTESSLGARYDMEVDAYLILVLSVLVGRSSGWWVVAVGAVRYAFVAAARVAPWLTAPLPPRFGRKVVAATQGVVLVVAASGLFWRPLVLFAVAVSLGTLLWSFGRDVRWLWRHRHGTGPKSGNSHPNG